jgi:hypothetical protein
MRPEQLPMLFHPIWKSKLDKMVVLQPVTFRTKKSLICIKSFGQLTAMSFYQNLSKPITAGHQKQWFH